MDGFQIAIRLLVYGCVGAAVVVCFPIFIWFFGMFFGLLAAIAGM